MNRRDFLISSLGSATASRFAVAQPGVLSAPMRLDGALAVVTARVGGTIDVQFLLDTGAAVSVFSMELASRVGLKAGAAVALSPSDTNQGVANAFIGQATWIELAGKVFKVSPAIADIRKVSAALGRPIHGILGNDAFRDHRLIIDYMRAELRVATGAPNLAIGSSSVMRFSKIPFAHAEVRIGRVVLAGEFGLDTGLDTGVKLYRPRAQLAFPAALTEPGHGVTISGEQTQAMGIVQSLILDGQDIGAVTANFAGLDKPAGASADYVGTIGAQAFLGRVLTLDYPSGWWSLSKG
jgi:hypothetical protein